MRLSSWLVSGAVTAVLLVGLPLAGVAAGGASLSTFLEFPPRTRYVVHAPFSWAAFAGILAFTAAWVVPVGLRALRFPAAPGRGARPAGGFPAWGWAGVALGAVAWTLAWTRASWFAPLQPHTFTPLWVAYAIVASALCQARTGTCLLTGRPRLVAALAGASALFWWFFEYLNRFVQNWAYQGPPFGPLEYVLYATLPFSTVLPAVLTTRDWLASFPALDGPFAAWVRVPWVTSRAAGALAVALSAAGLFAIGLLPDFLFPLLWVSPLLLMAGVDGALGRPHVFTGLARGDWRPVVTSAAAALVCGFFWEMWNWHSLSRWVYSVPFVHRFLVFEMPLLGFAGYLPFGVECLAAARLVGYDGGTEGRA